MQSLCQSQLQEIYLIVLLNSFIYFFLDFFCSGPSANSVIAYAARSKELTLSSPSPGDVPSEEEAREGIDWISTIACSVCSFLRFFSDDVGDDRFKYVKFCAASHGSGADARGAGGPDRGMM